jgi:hypothetical protein
MKMWQVINGYLYPPEEQWYKFRFKGRSPKIPPQKEPEVVTTVEDIANEEVKRQKRRSYLSMGKQSTMLSGIETQLKERLG